MTDPEISAKLTALEKLCGEATPGPWEWEWSPGNPTKVLALVGSPFYSDVILFSGSGEEAWGLILSHNALFIAASRSLLPAFVALLKEGLERHQPCDENDNCTESHPHCAYCDSLNWPCPDRLMLEKALEGK